MGSQSPNPASIGPFTITMSLGWGAMAVGLAGGILGVCAAWGAMSEDDGADDYNMGYDKGPAYDAGRPNGYV